MNNHAESILNLMKEADVIIIDDGPLLTSINIAEDAYTNDDPENQVARASWDSEGLQYDCIFTVEGLTNAKIERSKIELLDHEGMETTVKLFKLTSLIPVTTETAKA